MLNEKSPLEAINAACADWTQDTVSILRNSAPIASGTLKKSIKGRIRKNKSGDLHSIVFTYARYGVWVEKGAGLGAGGKKGSHWYNEAGDKVKTNPKSLGKMGIKRKAREWFEPTIQSRLELLSDILGREVGRSIVKYISQW
jgi:hypothetical protein